MVGKNGIIVGRQREAGGVNGMIMAIGCRHDCNFELFPLSLS
jgi:hypothetical protein